MKIVRTIVWVLLLVALTAFAVANWNQRVDVQIWPTLRLNTNIPAIVVVSFLIGFVPMWLLHRATKWQLRRRIGTLESTARTSAHIPIASDPTPAEPVPAPAPPMPAAEHPAPPHTTPPAPPIARVDAYKPPNVS